MTDIASLSIRVETLELENANRKMQGLGNTAGWLEGMVQKAMAAFGAYKVGEYIKEATLLAARYETLGVVMGVVGNNAGYTRAEMDRYATSLQKAGISMVESRNTLATMAQAHIDLSKSTELARLAQDAAVVGNMNSSEAFGRMIYGIQSGQTEILRTIGLNVNFEGSYANLARTLGKTTKELTEAEKSTARMNAVLEKAPDLAGAYEASMNTAGKQLLSMKRYAEDLQVVFGSLFGDTMGEGVRALNQSLQGTKKWLEDNRGVASQFRVALGQAASEFITLVSQRASVDGGALGFVTEVIQKITIGIAVVRDIVDVVRGSLLIIPSLILGAIEGLAEGITGTLSQIFGMKPPEWFLSMTNWAKGAIKSNWDAMGNGFQATRTKAAWLKSYAGAPGEMTETGPLGMGLINQEIARLGKGGGGGGGGSNDADRKKNEQEQWDALARSAAEYANALKSARQEYEMMQNTWETESQAKDAQDAAKYAEQRSDERRDYFLDKYEKDTSDVLARDLAIQKQHADDLKRVHTDLFGDLGYALDAWTADFGDAFVDMCFTGKNAFSDLVTSMLKDLAKMAVYQNVTSPLASWIKGLFGTPAAEGGYRDGSKPYLVGEQGPEIFNPGRSGTIIPNGAMGHTNQTSIVVNVASNGQPDTKVSTSYGIGAAKELEGLFNAWAMKQQRQGGIFAGA